MNPTESGMQTGSKTVCEILRSHTRLGRVRRQGPPSHERRTRPSRVQTSPCPRTHSRHPTNGCFIRSSFPCVDHPQPDEFARASLERRRQAPPRRPDQVGFACPKRWVAHYVPATREPDQVLPALATSSSLNPTTSGDSRRQRKKNEHLRCLPGSSTCPW